MLPAGGGSNRAHRARTSAALAGHCTAIEMHPPEQWGFCLPFEGFAPFDGHGAISRPVLINPTSDFRSHIACRQTTAQHRGSLRCVCGRSQRTPCTSRRSCSRASSRMRGNSLKCSTRTVNRKSCFSLLYSIVVRSTSCVGIGSATGQTERPQASIRSALP
jgi:hypothetical protein